MSGFRRRANTRGQQKPAEAWTRKGRQCRRPRSPNASSPCFWQEQSSLRLLTSWGSNDQHGVPACRERGSLRFHLWQHSHSVPVRWRRGVAQAEVARAGVAPGALAVERVERAAHPGPQATQAAGPAVRAATALLNPPAAKAVPLAMALLSRPAARAKIALTPQGRELGRGALVRTVKVNCNRHPTPSCGTSIGRQHYLSILDRSHSLLCLTVQGWHESPSVAAPWAGFRMHA